MKRLALLLLLAAPLLAQNKKQLTLEELADPAKMVKFGGSPQRGFDWLDETNVLWPKSDATGKFLAWTVLDVKSGKERAFLDTAKMQRALEAAGIPADAAKKFAESDRMKFDRKRKAILVDAGDDLYAYSLERNTASRLTSTAGKEEEATFSPDGQRVAFVRDNDLHVVDLSGRERQLTTDGSADILNGKLDYVYQEELYGRGNFKAFWWSPDSARIAFLRLDETNVPRYTLVDDINLAPDVKVFAYPKAGDPNPGVQVKIVSAIGGAPVQVDNSRYSAGDILVVNVTWAPDSKSLTYQVQNREQTWLELAVAKPSGESTTLIRETSKAWVDPLAAPEWLDDGSFLWQSERTGFRHIYHYKPDGTLIRQVTSGEWEVRTIHGADARYIYFDATERSVRDRDLYRVQFDGTSMKRLSESAGTHSVNFGPGSKYYIDSWSDLRTPPQVRLYRGDGTLERTIDANPVPLLAEYELPPMQMLQVKTRDGFVMEAMLVLPPNMDPAKKYPVFQPIYGGPHSQRVINRWGGQGSSSPLFLQYLAQQGIIGWVVDNRSASGKGAQSAWAAWKNAGTSELEDLEDALAWLKQKPYVDGARVALAGSSYGGFVVAHALTHSKAFSAGIAAAPVIDWRTYDSVYTERLMLMPQNNKEGYEKSSALAAAKNLHGHLLLIHGAADDNVHPQNTMQFARALQQEGKLFEMMIYPRTAHSPRDKASYHIQKLSVDFLRRRLLNAAE